MVSKLPSADLRAGYRKTFEICLAISIGLVIAAFKSFPELETRSAEPPPPSDPPIYVTPEPTVQRATPPPLRVPRIIIESVGDVSPDTFDLVLDPLHYVPAPPRPELTDDPGFKEIFEIPQPVGGFAVLQKNLVYPEMAKRVGREGTVIVIAFIDEQGTVRRTEVLAGIGLGCDEAAQTAVEKTRFEPATQRGKPVKVQVKIPVKFRLR